MRWLRQLCNPYLTTLFICGCLFISAYANSTANSTPSEHFQLRISETELGSLFQIELSQAELPQGYRFSTISYQIKEITTQRLVASGEFNRDMKAFEHLNQGDYIVTVQAIALSKNPSLKKSPLLYSTSRKITSSSSFVTEGGSDCPIICGTKQLDAEWSELQVYCKVSSDQCQEIDSYNLDTDFRAAAQAFVDDIGFNATINDDDLIWLRAYGAPGYKGHTNGPFSNKGGDGGKGGAINLVTSLADYRATYNPDAELYFLLSEKPTKNNYAGGSSLLYAMPFADPDEDLDMQYLLGVAGGGGGGSDGTVLESNKGHSGGDGGIALSYTENTCQVAMGGRMKGGGEDYQGDSIEECSDYSTLLSKAKKGSGNQSNRDPYSGIGGKGGATIDDLSVDHFWLNNSEMQNREINSGKGGDHDCLLVECGGAGGGGFGGGAAGLDANNAGGGGGSYVAMSTQTDEAANDLTGNDNDFGYLLVIFHLYADDEAQE